MSKTIAQAQIYKNNFKLKIKNPKKFLSFLFLKFDILKQMFIYTKINMKCIGDAYLFVISFNGNKVYWQKVNSTKYVFGLVLLCLFHLRI